MTMAQNFNHLASIIQKDPVSGESFDVNQSLDIVIEKLDFALADLKEGQYNDMPIKNPDDIPHYLESALNPVLEAAAAVQNTVSENKGWTGALSIAFEDRAKLGDSTTIDLLATEQRLCDAVNRWLVAAGELDPEGKRPLARNNNTASIGQLREVLYLGNDGWKPKPMEEMDKAGITASTSAAPPPA